MSDSSRLRIVVLRVMVLAILLTLLGRLGYLQLEQGASFRKAAAENRVRNVITPAARGQILDDKGRAFVNNRTALVVSVTRSTVLAQKHHGTDELARLSKIVDIPAADIALQITPCGEKLKDGTRASSKTGCWNGSPYQPVPIASYADDKPAEIAKVLQIREHQGDFPGVTTPYQAVRQYPFGNSAAHELGYLGPVNDQDIKNHPAFANLAPDSEIGRTGLEEVYDEQLRGVDGDLKLAVDKDGTTTKTLADTQPQAGQNLVLSIDEGVQNVAEKALATEINAARATVDPGRSSAGVTAHFTAPVGAAIVVEVNTGRIIAMASNPSYDPSLFVGGISNDEYRTLLNASGHPLLSNAVQGLYAPGSTFKIASTAGAVAAGDGYANGETYKCPGTFYIGKTPKHNFEGESPGRLSFRDTLIRSCDTVYYALAVDQWSKDGGNKNLKTAHEFFAKMDKAFGFGKKTGVDLPGEARGYVPTRASTRQVWLDTRANACAGAKRRPKSDPIQGYDEVYCNEGYRFNAGDAANDVIGQGAVTVTPLQLAMAYAALANGGTIYKPQLAKGFVSADGRTTSMTKPVVSGHLPVSQALLAYMRSALGGVVHPPGTAQTAFQGWDFTKLDLGGKTGTADVNNKAPTGWFASFAPLSAPKYAVIVMIPQSGTGGTFAARAARKIWAGMYGLDGQKAQLPNGVTPKGLPVVRNDGSIAPPGTPVTRPPLPTVSPSTGPNALSPASGQLWAEASRRSRMTTGRGGA